MDIRQMQNIGKFDRKKFNGEKKRIKNIVAWSIIAIFLIIISFYGALAYFTIDEVDSNGGIKNTIIKYGKELKSINDAINSVQ